VTERGGVGVYIDLRSALRFLLSRLGGLLVPRRVPGGVRLTERRSIGVTLWDRPYLVVGARVLPDSLSYLPLPYPDGP